MKNISLILFFVFCCFTVLSSCKSSGTEPVETYKDPRDMTWSIDTVYYPNSIQTLLSKLLVINSKDIFAYGWCDAVSGSLYRYNGEKWEVQETVNRLGKMISLSRTDIWGFGGGGKLGHIYHNTGNGWTEDKQLINLPLIQDASTDASGYIYGCGVSGIVIKYDGTTWTKEFAQPKLPAMEIYSLNSVGYYNNRLFFNGYSSNSSTGLIWYYFIIKDGDTYKLKDSAKLWSSDFKWGNQGFYKSPWGKYYSYGYGGIWEMVNNEWTHYYYTDSYYELIACIYGVAENYYLVNKNFKEILFYDGKKYISLKDKINIDYENIVLGDIWTDGKEVFAAGYTRDWPQKTLIIHGK